MRRVIITVAVVALGAATVGCRQGEAEALPGAGEPVYVFNLYGAEQGRTDQRPENLVVSEFSSMAKVTWKSWGPGHATGAGRLSGTWCLPHCQRRPYVAKIILTDVKQVKGKRYFTTFNINGSFPKPQETVDTLTGTLPTP